MIKRESYLAQVRPFYDSDLIKVITGIRRCGKSVLLEQIKQEIADRGNHVLYLNFEDRSVIGTISDADALLGYVQQNFRGKKLYLFLDEIQNLPKWAEAVKTLRLRDVSVFITGSNSQLLSSEFTQFLSGRYVAFRLRPFVYREALEYGKELGKEVTVTDFLVWGGFPKRLEFDGEAMLRYLNDVDDTIVMNDLITRYSIRKTALFKSLVNYVLRSNGRIFSAKSVYDYLKGQANKCSVNTIIKYMEYLREAYIIDSIAQYSKKVKQDLAFRFKIYNGDVALNSIRCFDKRYDLTHNLENIIYNELCYLGYDVKVYVDEKLEIDFMAVKNGKIIFIQVAYSVAEEGTYQREMAPFAKLDNANRKILLTCDEIDYSTSMVEHIRVKDFLLKGL